MSFTKFSKKQMTVLTWWCGESKYRFYDAVICDGAVRSGKTVVTFLSFILWALTCHGGKQFAVCGKTVSSVKRNIISPILPELKNLGLSVKFSESRNMLSVSFKGSNITVWLFGGRDESSAALIQGMTLAGVLFDEVALMPRSFVDQALARCSVENAKFWFNCNPASPNHWFYKEWIKKRNSKNALYLHFTMKDNPSLSKKTVARYEKLYDGIFYERYILGRWVQSEGLVYPNFTEKDLVDVPENISAYYISCDYGTVNPSSFGLWGFSDGTFYRVREFYYDSKLHGVRLTDEEYYEKLRNLAGGHNIKAIVCDPSAASFITLIRKKGEFSVIPAKNDVLDGIRRVGDALKTGKIKICRGCDDILREFGLYRFQESAQKDTVIKENDHAMDDMRYFVSTRVMGTKTGKIAGSVTR